MPERLDRTSRSRWARSVPRVLFRVLLGVLGLAAIVAVAAPLVIRGERFGRIVERMVPATCGDIQVGGGSWSWGALFALWRGHPAAFRLEDVRLVDPEGIEVLRARRASGVVELLGPRRSRVVLHDLVLADAGWRLARMKGSSAIGFVEALRRRPAGGGRCVPAASRPRPGGPAARPAAPAAPAAPARPPAFEITGARLEGVEATFEFPDWGLVLNDVHGTGRVSAGASAGRGDSGVRFEVSGAEARGGGRLRVLRGARRLELPFSRGRLPRVAVTGARPDSLDIEATDVATGRSRLALRGTFPGVMATPAPGRTAAGMDLRAELEDAADAVQAVVAGRLPGRDLAVTDAATGGAVAASDGAARLALTFAGPFTDLGVSAEASGLDVRDRLFDARDVALRIAARISPGSVRVPAARLSLASPGGGRLVLEGTVESDQGMATATFDRFEVGPLLGPLLSSLPPSVERQARGALQGTATVRVDAGAMTAAFERAALELTPAPGDDAPPVRLLVGGERAPRTSRRGSLALNARAIRFSRGTLEIDRVRMRLFGGSVSVSLRLALWDPVTRRWRERPAVELDAGAERLSVERIVDVGFVDGEASFRARARGPIDDLPVEVTFPPGQAVRILGDRFALPRMLALRVGTDGLAVPSLRLERSQGGGVEIGGRVDPSGAIDLEGVVQQFPLEKLMGLVDAPLPISGLLSGRTHVTRARRGAVAIAGNLALERTRFQGRPIGGGVLQITPEPRGGIRVGGRLIDGVTLTGTLLPGPDGVRGQASLAFERVPLDPFVPPLPGGLTAGGSISGTATLRLAPDQRPTMEGRLTSLTLVLRGRPPLPPAGPPKPGRAARAAGGGGGGAGGAVELRASGEARLSAVLGGGAIRIGPARFEAGLPGAGGRAGAFELEVESRGDDLRATLGGRLDLAVMAPLVRPWLGGLDGVVEMDLAASFPGTGKGAPGLDGEIVVVAPLVLRVPDVPFDVSVPRGRVRFAGNGLGISDLPVLVGGSALRLDGNLAVPASGAPRVALALRGDLDARLALRLLPDLLARAEGSVHLDAEVRGPLDALAVRARASPGRPLSLTPRGQRAEALKITGGAFNLELRAGRGVVTLRSLMVSWGAGVHLTLGPAGSGPGRLEVDGLVPDRLTYVDVPAVGVVGPLDTPAVRIDSARFGLRLTGDPRLRMRLFGQAEVAAARVRPLAAKAAGSTSSLRGNRMLERPELARTELDVRVRSAKGAVVVEVPRVPDLRVGIDYQIRGTLKRPEPKGRIHGADGYSMLALWLYKMFN